MLGILGNNARNLLYIKKFNDKKAIRLANNKLETKNFLSERGIPFAKTYAILSNRNELYDFDFSALPKKNFVIKPNHGSKGNGIYITKYLGHSEEMIAPKIPYRKMTLKKALQIPVYEHKNDTYGINNNIVPDSEFRRQLLDIIDGKYSMNLGNDKIIVEEKLIPGELFKEFCEWGLADIRVIVFNLVPVATMIRVPTEESKGKANLAQGGIGLGIDIATGKVISLLYKNKMYKNRFPRKFSDYKDKRIPYRNDILLLSSKVQYYVNLGYLALDRVITNDGPKLLEINARAGLEVQKVTDTRLARTLDKISDLKIADPEKGVEIAKSLFAKEHSTNKSNEKILYLSQYGKLNIRKSDEEIKKDVIVEVHLDKEINRISPALHQLLKEKKTDYSIDLFENEIILSNPKLSPLESLPENKIILGKRTAEEFLIKPIHKIIEVVNALTDESLIPKEEQELHRLDILLNKINRKLRLSSKLRPTNYFNELDKFISLHGNYNPVFTYKRPTQEQMKRTDDELKKFKIRTEKLESPIKKLFLEKADELRNNLMLIKAYKEQNFKDIEIYNEKIFGSFNDKILRTCKEKMLSNPRKKRNEESKLGKILKLSEIEDIIEKHLTDRKIYGVDIIFSYDTLSRISVIMGKQIKISISKSATFKEEGLRATLAHEIDTHLIRYINGIKTGWEIFKSGTGHYLGDEEGFAIQNANKILPDNYERIAMFKKYFLTEELRHHSFARSFEIIKTHYPSRSMEGCFKTIIRSKKGIIYTSKTGAGYRKDKIYLDGFNKVHAWLKKGNDPKKLYKGKIKIEDLDFIT